MAEGLKPELEYFGQEKLQSAVKSSIKVEHSPISAIQYGCPIEFSVPGSFEYFLDLTRSYLYLRARILQGNGNNIAAGAQVGPANLVLHTLFSSMSATLNGKNVSEASAYYGTRSKMETAVTFNPDLQNSQLQTELWYKDTLGSRDDFRVGPAGTNVGLRERARWFAESHEVELMGRPHLDIFHACKAIPTNMPFRLKLTPSRSDYVLVTPAPANADPQENYRIEITYARLIIHMMKISPSMGLAFEKTLQSHNARIPLTRVLMKHISIPAGYIQTQQDNIYNGVLPQRILMVMLSDAALNGGYQADPHYYHHFNVNYLTLYIDGQLVPNIPFQPNFERSLTVREYNNLFESLDVQYSSRTVPITRREFEQGSTIWIFDLTADHSGGSCPGPSRIGTVRIEARFAQALPATTNLVFYAEYLEFIEFDKYRNVTASF